MTAKEKISEDPFNLVITGVGGQGNVLASRMVGDMMTQLGFFVTIGETFGASQRGGSVMSHLRISSQGVCSPLIPRGAGHMVVSLEPIEAIRVLAAYGNPGVKVLCNTRPIAPAGVIRGSLVYPRMEDLRGWVMALSETCWFIDATDKAVEMGNPIFANVICVGALSATGVLPLERERFRQVLGRKMGDTEKIAMNLAAFDAGRNMIMG